MKSKKLLKVKVIMISSQVDYTNKAKIPIDLATLRDFLFYLIFGLATSFLIVCIKFTGYTILSQEILRCFFRELFMKKVKKY
tara:strand:- start:444 stop:689 length:246 start_codon:yes stop_codon:yes gene_type:complete